MGKRWLLSIFLSVLYLNLSLAQPVYLKNLPNNSSNFISSNGKLYYTVGDSLWKSDGTPAGTVFVKKIGEFAIQLTDLTVGASFFFTTNEASGKKAIWKSDGTAVNTVKITSYNSVLPLRVFNGELYLAINNGTIGTELYKTSGATPTLIKDINPGSGSGFVGDLMVSSGQLFFRANSGSGGINIWKSNGTNAGTVLAADIAFDDYSYLTDVNGIIYFGRNTFGTYDFGTNSKAELWKTNGTTAGTVLLKRFALNEQEGYIEYNESIDHFIAANGKLYFHYYQNYESPAYEFLYESNGTEVGTHQVLEITIDGFVPLFTGALGKIVYEGNSQGFPNAVKAYDPTTATSYSLKPQADQFTSEDVHEYAVAGNYFFFADAIDAYAGGASIENSQQLWQTNLTPGNAVAVKTLFTGTNFSGTDNITPAGDKIFFTTQSPDNQFTPPALKQKRLYYYDPTKPIVPVHYFTVVNADTDEEIQVLEMGDLIEKPANVNISIRYHQVGTPGSVVFKLADTIRRIENGAPYLLAGDVNGNYSPWLEAKTGLHKVTAIPYSQGGGNGTAGAPLVVEFYLKALSNTPVANAGPDRVIQLPKDSVIIYGKDSDDGTINVRQWQQLSGPNFVLSYIDNKLFTDDMIVGEYMFRYTVIDNDGQSGFDDVKVTVTGASTGGMRVVLVNSNSDQDIRDLKLNDTIIYNSSVDKITIRAIPTQTAGSVKFFFGNSLYRTENSAPYALQGDNNGNYNAWPAAYTTYNLIVRAYSGVNGSGTILEEKTMTLLVKQPGSTPPPNAQITFTLVNAVTDQDIGPLVNGQTINLASIGTNKLNIRANSSLVNTKSVVFAWDGVAKYKTEGTAPYSLFGDNNGNYNQWTAVPGTHTLKATPYTGSGGSGTAGVPLEITFTITGMSTLAQTASLKTYPNPAAHRLSVDLENFESESVSIAIYDEFGSLYYEGKEQVKDGAGNYDINLLDLNMKPGIYMVRIKSMNTGEEKVIKIMKE